MAEGELSDRIRENAQAPARASGDGGSVEQHPLREQIEADRYLSAKQATKRKNVGLKFAKLVPPGAD